MFNICNCKGLLNELKCKQCSKILSVLPVYFCSALGNICGRCIGNVQWMVANGTLERATAYEAVAKFLVFPCSNYENGCEAKLTHLEIVQHEQQCKSVLAQCPFNIEFEQITMKCDWVGTAKNIVEHLQSNHKDFLQVGLPSFVMNVFDTHINIFFTTCDNQTFIVITQYLKTVHKFYCLVMCCDKTPSNLCYRYQLEMGRHNDYFLILRKTETEAFCTLQDVVNSQDKMITVDVASLHAMMNEPNALIYCKISILKKSKKEVSSIMGTVVASSPSATTAAKSPNDPPKPKAKAVALAPTSSKKVPLVNPPNLSKLKLVEESKSQKKANNLIDELECPVCNDYMIPPIFICPTGHSICNECRMKMQVCPMCRFPLQDVRNFTLEKLACSFNYPCSYKDYGCNVSLTHDHIKLHQLNCNYAYGRCPLKSLALCNHNEDIVDLIGHLKDKHSSYMVEANRQYSRDIVGKVTSSYWATTFENEIFIICCKHSSLTGPVKFNILHVGMNKNKPKYKFELHFCDQTGNGLRLIISQLCKVFPPNPSSALTKCLMVPQDLLQPFVSKKGGAKLFFKFYIHRL